MDLRKPEVKWRALRLDVALLDLRQARRIVASDLAIDDIREVIDHHLARAIECITQARET